MTNGLLITVKQGSKTVYTCAVYGNRYEKVVEKIADLFDGVYIFAFGNHFIQGANGARYDVYIDIINKIFLP